ncbi:MAG: DNA repair protein [Paracoccaceae bacterium]
MVVVTVLAIAAIGYTIAAATGLAPWLTLTAQFGEVVVPEAGMILQIAVTALLACLLAFLPASSRVLRLEQSHRDFHVKMEDVARAFYLAHTADRSGVFTASSEFDQVRERLAYLRDHPDLERLEAGALELASQMSQQARHLADVYSDEKVARARDFLRQRQQEVERQQVQIVEANQIANEIGKWAQEVEIEESIVASQLGQLEERLNSALPAGVRLQRATEAATANGSVVALKPTQQAAE